MEGEYKYIDDEGRVEFEPKRFAEAVVEMERRAKTAEDAGDAEGGRRARRTYQDIYRNGLYPICKAYLEETK